MGWGLLGWQHLCFLPCICFPAGWPFNRGLLWWKTKDCLIPNQRYHCHSVIEPMSSWIFSLRREMICITDSVICRRQWSYQITKTWTWIPLALKFVLFVPPYTYSREVNHQTFMCSSSAFNQLSARPDTLEDALKLRLPFLIGSLLSDCWGLFRSADFSSKCWTVILFLLVLGKLEFCSWRLGWLWVI